MRLDLFAQIFGRAANHQAGNKHRQDGKHQHAVKPGADTAKHHFAKLHHHHRHHAAQWREGIVHGIDRAARRRRGDHREQTGSVDAEAQLFALHIAARLQRGLGLVNTQRQQQRVARLFGGGDNHHGGDKHQRHGGQHGPALARIANHPAKGKAQGRRNQEDRQHLKEIAQGGGVFIRVRRIGVEKTTAVGTQHLDGFLRRHRAHGQRLRVGPGVFHDGFALRVFKGLAIRAVFGLLVGRGFERGDGFVAVKVLNHALPDKQHGQHQRQRHQQPRGDARQVDPEVADNAGRFGNKAANQRKHHGNASGRRQKVLHRQRQHLRQVAHC